MLEKSQVHCKIASAPFTLVIKLLAGTSAVFPTPFRLHVAYLIFFFKHSPNHNIKKEGKTG